ncbi:MAG: redoxin domain-containing protein, partial [Gammaproteobacteria bacterium]|nr:redoxin domain-containing protein [Gammaproteobacteria bacterium]
MHRKNILLSKTVLARSLFFILTLLFNGCSAEVPQNEAGGYDNTTTDTADREFAPGLPWLNVERPLTFDDLRGKVVILDFWTYGCINCIHVLADLKKLEAKFGHQLLVIGVHTPKFDNEKNLDTLQSIVVRYGIEHPVVSDVDSMLASIYGMRAWPTRVLIDPAGSVLGRVTGEGRYDLFVETIEDLLEEHAALLDPTPIPLKLEREQLTPSLLAAPGKIAASDQYVAISDTLHHRVILLDHAGKILKTFGGTAAGREDGPAGEARFDSPQGLVFDK